MSYFHPEGREKKKIKSCGSFPRKTHAGVWYAVSGELAAISANTAQTQDTLGGAGLHPQPSVPYLHPLTFSLCPVFQLQNSSGCGSLCKSLFNVLG